MSKYVKNTEYQAAKIRMDAALNKIKTELMRMQEQDQELLRQLLHIHYTIATLSGRRTSHRLSCSSTEEARSSRSSTDSGQSDSVSRSGSFMSRRQSEPADRLLNVSYDDAENDAKLDATDGGDDSDQDASVFNSSLTSRDSYLLRKNNDIDTEDGDILSPLRTSFITQRPLREKNQSLTNQTYSNNHVTYRRPIVTQTGDNSNRPKYEIAYGQLLRSSSKLWKDVQRDIKEHGTTDEKKMSALQVIF